MSDKIKLRSQLVEIFKTNIYDYINTFSEDSEVVAALKTISQNVTFKKYNDALELLNNVKSEIDLDNIQVITFYHILRMLVEHYSENKK